jgi:2'-5' RNA ligase
MNALTAKPFTLVFDRIGSFGRGSESLIWLGAAYNKALFDVQRNLTQNLRAAVLISNPKIYASRHAVPKGRAGRAASEWAGKHYAGCNISFADEIRTGRFRRAEVYVHP